MTVETNYDNGSGFDKSVGFRLASGAGCGCETACAVGWAMGNDGFRVEDSGLMSARGGNPLSSVLSPVSASDNGDDWEQLISYGGSRL